MNFRYQALIGLIVVSLAGGLIWNANHYHTKFQDEKLRADKADQGLTLANQTISDMQMRQRDVAALDAKYTGELTDAKATIDQLRRDVAVGTKRLRLSATCGDVLSSTRTTSMDDATRPRLTDAAERNYFTLRERIEVITRQLSGLQQYVDKQCKNSAYRVNFMSNVK